MKLSNSLADTRRPLALGTAAILAATLGAVAPPAASAAPATSTCTVNEGDDEYTDNGGDHFDSDRFGDLAYAVPQRAVNAKARAGAVVIRLGDGRSQVLTRASLGLGAPGAGDLFGTAVIAAHVDADACTDLLIGAPGVGGHGAVYVVFGADRGLGTGRASVALPASETKPPRPLNAGDRFGESVGSAPLSRTAGSPHPGVSVIVGAPGVDDRSNAPTVVRNVGIVARYVVRADDTGVHIEHLGYLERPGRPEAGDQFGEVLLVDRQAEGTRVVVGVPHEDVGKKKDAGAVVAYSNATNDDRSRTTITQNSRGVATKAEAGDRFGAALSSFGGLAVGVPGENLGRTVNAGAVQLFRTNVSETGGWFRRTYRPTRFVTQDSPRVRGKAERGDALGTSLASGVGVLDEADTVLAIGAPGEDVGKVRDAGAVTVLITSSRGDGGYGAEGACPKYKFPCGFTTYRGAKASNIGPRLKGTPRRGDRLGQTVRGIASYRGMDDGVRIGWFLFGAPGTDAAGRRDSGAVVDFPSQGRSDNPFTPVAGDRLGG